MSKSYGNTIEIFPESEKKLQKRCNKIITSSTPMGEPLDYDGCNLYSLISLFLDDERAKKGRLPKEGRIIKGSWEKEGG